LDAISFSLLKVFFLLPGAIALLFIALPLDPIAHLALVHYQSQI